MMKKLWNRFRSLMRHIRSIRGEPPEIAKGYALGIFLATTPFIGLKIFIALFVAGLFRWNKAASAFGVYHINPFTAPPFYAVAFLVGKAVLGVDVQFTFPDQYTLMSLVHLFIGTGQIFLSLLAGGLILGIPLTFIAYVAVKRILVLAVKVRLNGPHST